jgi:hypothetical protein
VLVKPRGGLLSWEKPDGSTEKSEWCALCGLVPNLVPSEQANKKANPKIGLNALLLLVRPERFERPTPWFVVS